MWVCRHAATLLPETPFNRETEIMSGITDKVCGLQNNCLLCEVESGFSLIQNAHNQQDMCGLVFGLKSSDDRLFWQTLWKLQFMLSHYFNVWVGRNLYKSDLLCCLCTGPTVCCERLDEARHCSPLEHCLVNPPGPALLPGPVLASRAPQGPQKTCSFSPRHLKISILLKYSHNILILN